MAIVHLGDMLGHAYRNDYAIGGFHLFSLESLTAVIGAAEACRAPVILNIAQNHADLFDLETLVAAAEHAAARAGVPVALHFDHGKSVSAAVEAIRWGCNGVTFDGSQQELPDNIDRTREVVAMAHECGVPVEGIVGCIAGEHHPGTREYGSRAELTSVEEARAFVERTGVDSLAVSVGTCHGRSEGKCKLDLQRIAKIRAAVDVPLVVHGGSGLTEEQIRRLSATGIAKINYYTALVEIAQAKLAENVRKSRGGAVVSPLVGVTEAIRSQVEAQLRALGSAGRAAEVLLRCRPWQPVEHVIVFNVSTSVSVDIQQLMAHGRRVLSDIPGVRRVYTGRARKADAAYRFCWLVQFVHPAVIDSYREHPLHKKFADEVFRPIVPNRITIDFEPLTPAEDPPGSDPRNFLFTHRYVPKNGEKSALSGPF